MSAQHNKLRAYLMVYGPILIQSGLLLILGNGTLDIAIIYTLVIFLLSESHFAATYLFFVSKANREWFFTLRTPVLQLASVCASGIVIGLFSVSALVFCASIVSGFHVIRQSIGIRKLVSSESRDQKSDVLIYCLSFCCLGLAGFRFLVIPHMSQTLDLFRPFDGILNDDGFYIGLASILVCLCVIICVWLYRLRGLNLAIVVHGSLTYVPYLLFENQVLGHLASVSAHWVQYLVIQVFVFDTRFAQSSSRIVDRSPGHRRRSEVAYAIVCIVTYSAVMTIIWLRDFSVVGNATTSRLLIIPVIFQLCHYLIDAHIWRFRDPFLAKSVGEKLKQLVAR